jgi:hypothetical protein
MENQKAQRKLASDGKSAIATSPARICTAQQMRVIYNLSKELRISSNQESRRLFNCRFDQLSTSGAADLIAHLEEKKGGSQNK